MKNNSEMKYEFSSNSYSRYLLNVIFDLRKGDAPNVGTPIYSVQSLRIKS